MLGELDRLDEAGLGGEDCRVPVDAEALGQIDDVLGLETEGRARLLLDLDRVGRVPGEVLPGPVGDAANRNVEDVTACFGDRQGTLLIGRCTTNRFLSISLKQIRWAVAVLTKAVWMKLPE